jgi:hypothetical protein
MDIVTVSDGCGKGRPFVGSDTVTVGRDMGVEGTVTVAGVVCCDTGTPTSNGSNLFGDSPIILPLAEAASDISGFD